MSEKPCEYLILIKGKDKTSDVQDVNFDGGYAYVNYKNGDTYYKYRLCDVILRKDPKILSVGDKIVLVNGKTEYGVQTLQSFGDYYRIIYKSGYQRVCEYKEVKVIDSVLRNDDEGKCFGYLRELADAVGLDGENGNILANHYKKIDFVREDCILAAYLAGKRNADSERKVKCIFPFGFNASQKKAVENALGHSISFIEGPPGTGKTQTILNIIANAVILGKNVAMVSKNNSAVENVYDKLKKYGLDFIVAQLGKADNKKAFIAEQTEKYPDMTGWENGVTGDVMLRLLVDLSSKIELKNELARLNEEEKAVKSEQAYFEDYYKKLDIRRKTKVFSSKISSRKLLDFASEYEYLTEDDKKLRFWKRLALKFRYGYKTGSFSDWKTENVVSYCHKLFFEKRIAEIQNRKAVIEKELHEFDFDKKMRSYSEMSLQFFKRHLYRKYRNRIRPKYEERDLFRRCEEFLQEYPIILSTTYSITECLSNKVCYDYVIIDEASQVDIATGALALLSAKNIVVVGDVKQLSNVVDGKTKGVVDKIFDKYGLPNAYRYSDHNILSSMKELFPTAPEVLLKEHYRCHPEIIGFCNKMFYNGELVIMTEAKSDEPAMAVYRTKAGNMAMNNVNERQIEVIKNEVIPDLKLNPYNDSIGIVTAYNKQAARLKQEFSGTAIKAETVDKFQGQERDVMILSTVDNKIGDFVSNPNRLNVAVSRAKNKFIVVTDGNDNDRTSAIYDLICYIRYNGHEVVDSKICSIFDYLYEVNATSRAEILKKYGRISEFDSENLAYALISDILKTEEFSSLGVAAHVPLRQLIDDLSDLEEREVSFVTNVFSHVDFLIYRRTSHLPAAVIEVDGFTYHNTPKQKERDGIKDAVLKKYHIPILRLSTVGSGEETKITEMLRRAK